VVQNVRIERRLMEMQTLGETQFCPLLLQAHSAASKTLDSRNREIMPPKLNTIRSTSSDSSRKTSRPSTA
jgi:hypothetical protein